MVHRTDRMHRGGLLAMRPVIYVVANKRLNMSAGKLAAQVGHAVASVMVYENFTHREWMSHPHRWLIVLQAMDDVHLMAIRDYLDERKVRSHLIIDEGVNEIRPYSYTALGVQILDKDGPEAEYLSGLKMYKDDMHTYPVERPTRWESIKSYFGLKG